MRLELKNKVQVEALKLTGFKKLPQEKQTRLLAEMGPIWGNILNHTPDTELPIVGGAEKLAGLLAQLAKNAGLSAS